MSQLTLHQFIDLLIYMDNCTNECNMFNCNPRQLEMNTFAYDFDGYLTCILQFTSYGTIRDSQDVNVREYNDDETPVWNTYPSTHYKNIDDYLNEVILSMNDPRTALVEKYS